MLILKQLWNMYKGEIGYDTKQGMFLVHKPCNQRMAEVRLPLSFGKTFGKKVKDSRKVVLFLYCPFCGKKPPAIPKVNSLANWDDFVTVPIYNLP